MKVIEHPSKAVEEEEVKGRRDGNEDAKGGKTTLIWNVLSPVGYRSLDTRACLLFL